VGGRAEGKGKRREREKLNRMGGTEREKEEENFHASEKLTRDKGEMQEGRGLQRGLEMVNSQ